MNIVSLFMQPLGSVKVYTFSKRPTPEEVPDGLKSPALVMLEPVHVPFVGVPSNWIIPG